jgi:hypothetical protein
MIIPLTATHPKLKRAKPLKTIKMGSNEQIY